MSHTQDVNQDVHTFHFKGEDHNKENIKIETADVKEERKNLMKMYIKYFHIHQVVGFINEEDEKLWWPQLSLSPLREDH